jgi:3-isopropylmalate/(R)-2-methylmalate dehydratase small subunit
MSAKEPVEMQKFIKVTGIAAPLLQDNVNTDAIIPVPWMKTFGADLREGLFGRWRYFDGDIHNLVPNPEFVLNRTEYAQACVLVAKRNFGCGSSREQAVWALLQYGIRVVIAESFGDIFYNNCFNNGLLPIRLPATQLEAFSDIVVANAGRNPMTVDLENRQITAPDGSFLSFEIDAARRQALLEGLDMIGISLKHEAAIAAFEERDRVSRSWIYPISGTVSGS